MSKRKIPVEKNQNYRAVVEDYTHEGWGVAKIEGYPIFIEGAMEGEEVTFKAFKSGKSFAQGRLTDIHQASPDRVPIQDPVYAQTGTMDLAHMSYPAQLKFKQGQVENALRKIGNLTEVQVQETLGMESPYRYRNKAQVPVRADNQGHLVTGAFRKKSHDLIPIEDFLIQDPVIDQTIIQVRQILEKYGIKAYDDQKNTGHIRHILVRRGHFTGDIMVVLVTRTPKLPHKQEIVGDLEATVAQLVSVVQNINPKKTNLVLGRKSQVLYRQDSYRDRVLNLEFNISHQSFFQVNSKQTEALYRTAIDLADIQAGDQIVDAYCGIGTLTLSLAKEADQVYGVEVVPQAVSDAIKNADLNQIKNVHFVQAKAEKWLVDQAKVGMHADLIFVDPPRKGLDSAFIEAAIQVRPRQIVYISCNPGTLARDLNKFTEAKYQLTQVQPIDMFPQTHHVETVVLMTRK